MADNAQQFIKLIDTIKNKRVPRTDNSIQHFAVFVQRNKSRNDVSIGENKHMGSSGFFMSMHAEMDALNKLKSKGHYKREKYDLFVVRFSRTGKLGESRPCFHCLDKLEKSGIKIQYVYYSTKNDYMIKEKFKHMKQSDITTYCSGYRRNMSLLEKPVTKFVYD